MLIYEGDELVLHYEAGDTDYIVITFQGAHHTDTALTSFFADTPLKKNRITALGVTTKVDHWYISPDTEKIVTLIEEIATDYQQRILIGPSMGGHAAIAFSKRLKATSVFSCAPKWSLDSNECDVLQYYVDQNFRPGMEGMGLRQEQTSGQIFITYDPEHGVDAYHIQKISAHLKDAVFIKTFYSGHVVFDHLSGSANLLALVNALCSKEAITDVPRAVSKIRRSHYNNIIKRLERSTPHHPLISMSLIENYITQKNSLKEKPEILSETRKVLASLYWNNYENTAQAFTRRIALLIVTETYVPTVSAMPPKEIGLQRIMTFHGTILCYDIQNKNLTCQDAFIPDKAAQSVLRSPENYLCISLHGQILYLTQENNNLALTYDLQKENALKLLPFDPSHVQNKKLYRHKTGFLIQTQQGYVCASPTAEVTLNSPNCLEWESYLCIPH